MISSLEAIKEQVEISIASSLKRELNPSLLKRERLGMNLPNCLIFALLDYWSKTTKTDYKKYRNDKDNRLKRIFTTVAWLHQTNNAVLAQKISDFCEYPMTRGQGVQLFALMVYRYYYGDLSSLLFKDDPERRTGYYSGRKKVPNSSTIRKTDLEFQAITLALQFIGYLACDTREKVRPSTLSKVTVTENLNKPTIPQSSSDLLESALRPALAIHTIIVQKN